MNKNKQKLTRRTRRRTGIRKRITGLPDRPRLSVYRSNKHTYAQLIDDMSQTTIVAASTCDKGFGEKGTGNADAAKAVGKSLAEKAKAAGVSEIVFDRGGFRYHGRIRALADGAREGGLTF